MPTELRVVNRLAGTSTAGFLSALLLRIVLVQIRTEISDSGVTQADLNRIALRLNQRPRRTLDFQCPAYVFDEAVALTG